MNFLQTKKENKIVSQLLPKHAYENYFDTRIKLREDKVDHFSDCSILYADIAGFTKYSSLCTSEQNVGQVVRMLQNLFTKFDQACFANHCYKVCTIGDCYVAIGFDDAKKRNPIQEAKNLVKFGREMVKIIQDVRIEIGYDELNMRIGIHTGVLIGGIIGTEVVRYDIYGADNMIANDMESNGLIGNVMVSETTKEMLDQDKGKREYAFIERDEPVESKASDQKIRAFYIVPRVSEANKKKF